MERLRRTQLNEGKAKQMLIEAIMGPSERVEAEKRDQSKAAN